MIPKTLKKMIPRGRPENHGIDIIIVLCQLNEFY